MNTADTGDRKDGGDFGVVVDDLWLFYPLVLRQGENFRVRLRCLLLDLLGRAHHAGDRNFFAALRGVSFRLKRGEILGLIGPNGAGKSTLLRVLAGIERPDRGRVELSGRVSSLLSLGVGFRSELSGRENIRLNSMLLGIPRSRVEKYMEEVIELCDIGKFVDAPVETYSAGMKARLGFSIATKIDPEILLVDEVLGTGDAAFRARAGSLIHHYRSRRKTVLVATHSEEFILNNCDRALFLNEGRVAALGYPEDVLDEYRRFTESLLRGRRLFEVPPPDGEARDRGVRLGLCAGHGRSVRGLEERLELLAERGDGPRFETVTVVPGDCARPDLADRLPVLLIPDVEALSPEQYVGLRRYVREGGVLLLGPRAARRVAGSRSGAQEEAEVENYGLGALGKYEPARVWGRFEQTRVRLTRPGALLDDAGSVPGTGALVQAAPGAWSVAKAALKDLRLRAIVGEADALVARPHGRGLVFRFAADLDAAPPLLLRLLEKLLDAGGLRSVRERPPSAWAVAAADEPEPVPGPLAALRMKLSPVVGRGESARLMTRAELASALRQLAELSATHVCLLVKAGCALVPGLGLEVWPFVDRDVLAEARDLAGPLGLEVVPSIACFTEHAPDEPGRPTPFAERHAEALHLTLRQVASGLRTADDFRRRGERILASAHLPIVRDRLRGALAALTADHDASACHLEFFRFSNDRGGFSPAELEVKGLTPEDDPAAHERQAEQALGSLAESIRREHPGLELSVEAYHRFAVTLSGDTLTVPLLAKKPMPADIFGFYLARRLDLVAATRPVERSELLIDARHLGAREIAARAAVARRLGMHRVLIDGHGALAALPDDRREALARALATTREHVRA